MMTGLLSEIKTRLTAALDGVTYPTPVGGLDAVPSLHIGALPPKRSQVDQDHDFPFVVIRPGTGSFDRNRGQMTVLLICGTYTADGSPDSTEDGIAAVNDLAWRCLELIRNRSFPPWRLALPAAWTPGDDKDFNQPRPYYLQTVELTFTTASMADIT